MNQLIDVNECSHLVNLQMKQDVKNYTNTQLLPKVNIILRKDTVKSDLAQFHHGALFSPV